MQHSPVENRFKLKMPMHRRFAVAIGRAACDYLLFFAERGTKEGQCREQT